MIPDPDSPVSRANKIINFALEAGGWSAASIIAIGFLVYALWTKLL